jgi:hypothetical protein
LISQFWFTVNGMYYLEVFQKLVWSALPINFL